MLEQDRRLHGDGLRLFGRWEAALRAAGIDPDRVRRHRRWSRRAVIDRIGRLAAERKPLNLRAIQLSEATLAECSVSLLRFVGRGVGGGGHCTQYLPAAEGQLDAGANHRGDLLRPCRRRQTQSCCSGSELAFEGGCRPLRVVGRRAACCGDCTGRGSRLSKAVDALHDNRRDPAQALRRRGAEREGRISKLRATPSSPAVRVLGRGALGCGARSE